jgi:outer membrane protein OmpA-like peptidoglycan-associated protein
LRLSDYNARLEITEQGRLNLQTLVEKRAADAPAGAASAAPARSGTAAALPVDLLIGAAQLNNGHVDFHDRFIRPNYSAELTELNGRLGRFDSNSRDMATLQFDGRVAGTGLLHISGAVNPTIEPLALDIRAKATDIELPGLTPYAAKYAGYPIERGKLSMDVSYKIDADGKLQARNQIIVNQLTFGPKSDSPDATSLPVRLAVALLQDSNGVIDIDLPVSGSLDDPQFSIGGLFLKAIVNLLTKVLTAPFSMLAGSSGTDLSTVEFTAGTADLAAGSQAVIDKVAKALAARPGLKLSVTGQADAKSEAQAMQHAALEARIVAEQRRDLARASLGGAAAADAALPPLQAAERARIVHGLYADAPLPDKPRDAKGVLLPLPPAQMEALLAAAVPVDAAATRALAVQRGRRVREALIAKGLGGERLFLAEPKGEPAPADNAPWKPQARLALSTD